MTSLTFSIVIPAYNNAAFLGEAIQSVLNQTYPNFELIIVNDASPDNTADVVNQFNDQRIRYIVHQRNLGLSAARNTGISASSGEWIALLDGDDFFHPDKLKIHEEFIRKNQDIGVTYNSRFEMNHSAKTIRELWRPPLRVTLSDLVFGFPFGPSDMVVKREWMFNVGLFDVTHTYVGEDLDINCKLALAGCTFANVDRALNYRRYYSGRVLKDLRFFVENTFRPLDKTFADPRCPVNVLSIRDSAYAQHAMLWANIAYMQGDTGLGRELSLKASRLNPSLFVGTPCPYLETMVMQSIMDESVDHEELLKNILSQLPPSQAWLSKEYAWAVAKGYFVKGTRALMWDNLDRGRQYLLLAAKKGFQINERMLVSDAVQLTNFENEFGWDSVSRVLADLSNCYNMAGWQSESRWLKGSFFIHQAFSNYNSGIFAKVPKEVVRAFLNNPKYLTNRGVLSVLIRSLIGDGSRRTVNQSIRQVF